MAIKQHLIIRSSILKNQVNRYAILGLIISLCSILVASILVSYQITGFINFSGIILAQKTNPALWALDLTPFMFAYWGQSFCYELANTMESMVEDKTRELVNKSGDLELKLHYETNHDHLTNLPNQRLLCQRITQGIKQLRAGEELAVIILHINGFKDINYKYGSFNGNSLLIQFAEKLKTVLLEPFLLQAYMGMNIIARLQGAEFAVLLPRLREGHDIQEILTKLLVSTASNFMIDGNSINITTTAGAAIYPLHGDTDIKLIRYASFSVFHAESSGQPYAIYQAGMDKSMKTDDVRMKELESAIDNEEVDVFYQPEIELKTGKIIGLATVIHLDQEKYGLVDTDQFTSLVQGTALVKKITSFVLRNAINQLVEWRQTNNLYPITVSLLDVTDKQLPEFIHALLKENHVEPAYLKIELTEKACLSDQARTSGVLKKLSEMGVKIVISDFCSGYSSFTYLTNFPINEIKIDKSFVMTMVDDEKKLCVVRAASELAKAMGLEIYADGITDEATLEKLKKMGYIYGQGPYISPAVDADGVISLLSNHEK